MTFFVPCDPPTAMGKNSKRAFVAGGKAVVTENPAAKTTKGFLAALFAPYAPKEPLEGPVSVHVSVTYPWPKSTSKKARAVGYAPKTTKPDVDAVLTTVLDVLQSLRFYSDDSQVWAAEVCKTTGDRPGFAITVTAYDGRETSL